MATLSTTIIHIPPITCTKSCINSNFILKRNLIAQLLIKKQLGENNKNSVPQYVSCERRATNNKNRFEKFLISFLIVRLVLLYRLLLVLLPISIHIIFHAVLMIERRGPQVCIRIPLRYNLGIVNKVPIECAAVHLLINQNRRYRSQAL